jgi:hypothetical protein
MSTLPKWRLLGAPLVGVKRNLWFTEQGRVKRANFPIDGLVLYAPLWHPELSGSPFLSKDLNAHTCTVTGATWGLQGRTFNGTSDYIDCGSNGVLFPSGDLTIEAWIQKNDALTEAGIVNCYASNKGYDLTIFGDNNFLFRYWASDGHAQLYAAFPAASPFAINTWFHLVVGRSGDTLVGWVNCNALTPVAVTGTLVVPAVSLRIGSQQGAQYLKGLEGEVRIYNRALSLAEVQHNRNVTRWRYA